MSYGRAISSFCMQATGSTCLVAAGSGGIVPLNKPAEVYNILSNTSTTTQVNSVVAGNKTFHYLANTNTLANLDYSASTIGVSSQCRFANDDCLLDVNSFNFNCSGGFAGRLPTQNGVGSSDTEETTNAAVNMVGDDVTAAAYWETSASTTPASTDNIYHTLYIGATLGTQTNVPPVGVILSESLESQAFILQCQASLFNFTYAVVNGTLQTFNATTLYNPSISALSNDMLYFNLLRPIRSGFIETPLIDGVSKVFYNNPNSSASVSSNSVNTVTSAEGSTLNASTADIASTTANLFSPQYNIGLLSSFAAGLNSTPNLAEQTRTTKLVARVPLAPFYSLVASMALFAAFAIVITLLAVCSHPVDNRDIQAQLGLTGLVLNSFETPRSEVLEDLDGMGAKKDDGVKIKEIDDLFNERHGPWHRRVGLRRNSDGGAMYSVWSAKAGAAPVRTDPVVAMIMHKQGAYAPVATKPSVNPYVAYHPPSPPSDLQQQQHQQSLLRPEYQARPDMRKPLPVPEMI
jgi:hypothetical protein